MGEKSGYKEQTSKRPLAKRKKKWWWGGALQLVTVRNTQSHMTIKYTELRIDCMIYFNVDNIGLFAMGSGPDVAEDLCFHTLKKSIFLL